LLGPAAYAVDTVATGHQGSIPLAGPATAGGPGGFRGNRNDRGDRADRSNGTASGAQGQAARSGSAGFGGPGEAQPSNSALVSLLKGAGTKWSAATVGTMQAARSLDVAGDGDRRVRAGTRAVTGPVQAYVNAGQVRYFLAGGGPAAAPQATR
jgi:hypothetical protein